jgi:hypothetical protein
VKKIPVQVACKWKNISVNGYKDMDGKSTYLLEPGLADMMGHTKNFIHKGNCMIKMFDPLLLTAGRFENILINIVVYYAICQV